MESPEVQILMSTYNGTPYLREQLDSILNQSFENWQLLIRDDGSKDSTVEIIKEYENQHPGKIKQVFGDEGGGSSRSFMGMLKHVESPYCMFSDQDDFWKKNKIEISLNRLKELEKEDPMCLVFTDMEVVSDDLKTELGSFLGLQKLNPSWIKNSNNLLAQSIAAGCTMIFTLHLIKIIKPIDANLFQHDHWVLINAAIYGNVAYVDERTIKYRQHSHNTIGSHRIDWPYFSKKTKELGTLVKRWTYIKKKFVRKVNIVKVFLAKLKVNLARL
ncbi:MAG: glycosyltransferase involved in cell wall biosynthesis [Vicingaceae bacterium]|jgi:glycosyltransferase involved in cell wall biosynthesis